MITEIQTFDALKRAVSLQFMVMAHNPLYFVEIDRDEIWDRYLSGFSEEERQEHNCGSCRAFLRQYGGIVVIKDNQVVSLWDDLKIGDSFASSIQNLSNYIDGRPVTDIFLTDTKKCGTDRNFDKDSGVTWQHFFLEVPHSVVKSKKDIPAAQGQARDDKNVLKRGLTELTLEATETVLELIAQGSLYRGKESEHLLEKFVLLQRRYARLTDAEKDNFCWTTSLEEGTVVSRIRNTAIGTLLINLSAGMDIDPAVAAFEKVVAPANYKRPVALVTPKMVEAAKEQLSELGLLSALTRRYATETDIPVFNLLFKDKPQVISDVFDEVSKDTLVNPKSLSKVEEIGVEQFLSKIVPDATSISVLLENNHMNNFVSLLTAKDPDAPTLFKWNNGFSWSYTGNIADSIKERVKAAGGNVVGELRTSLSWSNHDDLDIHVKEPNGNVIFFNNKRSLTSGWLDVDMNASTLSRSPVENIIWTDKSKMVEGVYQVVVNNYQHRETTDSGFAVQIECQGQVFDFEHHVNPRYKESQHIATFNYSKANGLTFAGEVKSNVVSKEKWSLKTNRFHKVTQLLLSPNHWENAVGNKHYFWMLENCVSDESPRPFFNEFLKPELEKHRKVFEILGGKVSVEASDNQLSGLGFSDTQRASVYVKAMGKFTKTLKVNI